MVPQPTACQIVVSFTERHATLSNLHILKIWKCDYFKFLYLKNNFWLCLFPDKFYIPVFSFCCSLVSALSFVRSKLPGGVFPSAPPPLTPPPEEDNLSLNFGWPINFKNSCNRQISMYPGYIFNFTTTQVAQHSLRVAWTFLQFNKSDWTARWMSV